MIYKKSIFGKCRPKEEGGLIGFYAFKGVHVSWYHITEAEQKIGVLLRQWLSAFTVLCRFAART